MKKVEPIQVVVFTAVLATVAYFINDLRLPRPVPQAIVHAPVESHPIANNGAAQAAANAAAEHSSYVSRYVDTAISRNPGKRVVAILVVSENGKPDRAVLRALTEHMKNDSVEISTSLFKPEFVSDGLFGKVFDGSTEILRKLDLSRSADALLFARESVRYSTNPSLDNVLTANMQMEIALIPLNESFESQAWTLTANGAGFHQGDARSLVEERILKQISQDTKISLRQ